MSFIHGKGVFVSLAAVDLSTFTNSVEFARESDSHDTTTFGKDAHTFQGGLLNGTVTLAGIYDDGAEGPQATIDPLIGTVVELVYQPKGTSAGNVEKTVNVLVMSYNETAPVADMISWECECQMSDDVTVADQV